MATRRPTAAARKPVDIKLSDKQKKALSSLADIVIFGGGNGGGKSFTLRCSALRPEYLTTPGCASVLFAESDRKLEMAGGMVAGCKDLYGPGHPLGLDGYRSNPQKRWRWPCAGGGEATIDLSYVGEPGQWDGLEAANIGVDQAEQITAAQFWSLAGRNRSSTGVRCRTMLTVNPPAEGREHWITQMLTAGGWIGADGYPVPENDGRVKVFARVGDDLVFGDTVQELEDQGLLERDRAGRVIQPKSMTFIHALVDDHPIEQFREDYKRELAQLPEVERLRRLRGNWYVTEESGKYFRAEFFSLRHEAEASRYALRVRSWDNAWSTQESADLTPGVLLALEPSGLLLVEDVIAIRGTPAHVERLIELVAQLDGKSVAIRLPKDAGAAGALQTDWATRLGGKGYTVITTRDQNDKITRSRPYQAHAERGQVRLCSGHKSMPVAQQMLTPFEIVDKDGQRRELQGLTESQIITLGGWQAEFIRQHVNFGRAALARRLIKKDMVDAAVGGYLWATSDEVIAPINPERLQSERASDQARRALQGVTKSAPRWRI